MLHAICYLASFITAIYGAIQIHDQHRASGNYIFVVGLLMLCLIITLDYITEQMQKKRAKRLLIRTDRRKPVNTYRTHKSLIR